MQYKPTSCICPVPRAPAPPAVFWRLSHSPPTYSCRPSSSPALMVGRHRNHATGASPAARGSPLIRCSPTHSIFTSSTAAMCGIILTAFVFLLRISEVAAIRRTDIRPGRFAIRAAKRDRTICWRPATSFIDQWLSYLRDSLPSAPSGGFSPAQLRYALSSVLRNNGCTWHSLRRSGATNLVHLGTTPEQLAYWGRWNSAHSARIYFDVQQPLPTLPQQFQLYLPDGSTYAATPSDLWPCAVLPPQLTLGPALSALPHCRPRQHRWCLQTLRQLLLHLDLHPSLQSLPHFLPAILSQLHLVDPAPDSMSPPSMLHLRPTPQSLLHGLGPHGNVSVPDSIWYSLGLPQLLPLCPRTCMHPNADAATMLRVLESDGLIFSVHHQPASAAFATAKTVDKARLICDMRPLNQSFPTPPRFRLPKLSALLDLPPTSARFFVKLDIANFFWSLLLPASVLGYFTMSAGDATYGTRRLPFGWSYSPIVGQRTLELALQPILALLPGACWQYVDDVLLSSDDPAFLFATCCYAIFLLTRFGFVISPKSQTTPTPEITWLGKIISGTFVANTPSRVAQALVSLWALRCYRLTFRALQRLLGYLQWLLAPSSLHSTFMASAYGLLQQTRMPTLLPRNIWRSLLVACLSAAIPLRRRALPPPLCMPLIYCDAAASPHGYVVAAHRPKSFASACFAPRWISSQQGAELYAVFHCLRQAGLRRISHVCVVTDNEAAFHTVNCGRVSARHWERVRVLRRIHRICLQGDMQMQLALTPSELNSADPFSRYRSHLLTRIPLLADNITASTTRCHYRRVTSALPRIWWSLSVLP